jgi:hypothetical protein
MLLVGLVGKFFQSFDIGNSIVDISIGGMAQPPVPFLITRELAEFLRRHRFCFDIKKLSAHSQMQKKFDFPFFPSNIWYIPDSSGS